MSIGTLFFILLVLGCPVGMMLMMRGGMMGGGGHTMTGGQHPAAATREHHIADLEQENARLSGAAPTADVPELISPRR